MRRRAPRRWRTLARAASSTPRTPCEAQITRIGRCGGGRPFLRSPCVRGHAASTFTMDKTEELLRRLALNDERVIASVLGSDPSAARVPPLERKTRALVRLGALLAVGAGTTSLRWMTEVAYDAGATEEDIVGVLLAVSPEVGCAGVVREAPRLALAIGYDVEDLVG